MRRGLLHGLVVMVCLPACQQVSGLSSLDFSDPEVLDEGAGAAGTAGTAGTAGVGGLAGASGKAGAAGQVAAGKGGAAGGGAGGGAGDAGASGTAGLGGLGGAGQGGQGGAGQGGGGAGGANCGPTNQAPKLALPGVSAGASSPFSIDLSTTTDPEGDALTFTFTPTGAAPAIQQTAANGPVATGLAGECGVYTYMVSVIDSCGQSASGSVTLTVGNGPYVSASTCDPGNQCGSVKHPFCDIQPAVNASLASPIKVAGGAYSPVQMKGAVDVEGGYEPTFLQPRDPTIPQQQVIVPASGDWGVAGPDAGVSTLDGVIVRFVNTEIVNKRAAILHAGGGTLALKGITIDVDPAFAGSTAVSASGVLVAGTAAGSLFIDTSQVTTAGGSNESAGLRVEAGATTKIQIASTNFQAGPSVDSVGVWSEAAGLVSISTGKAAGGVGTMHSAGLRVRGAAGGPVEGAKVTAVTLLGGTSPESVAVDAAQAKSLTLLQSTIDGQGTGDDGAVAIGVRAVGVEQLTISGGTVVGGSQGGSLGTSVGLRLVTAAGVTSAATLMNSKIRGGTLGAERIAIDTAGVPLDLEQGDIAGSSDPGGQRAVGVWVRGVFQGSDKVLLHGTSRLSGGSPTSGASPYQAYGVEVDAAVSVEVSNNEDIEGCWPSCTGAGFASKDAEGVGVRLRGGTSRVVTGNTSILGGGHSAAPGQNVLHAGVLGDDTCSDSPCALGLELTKNKLIAGNTDDTSQPERAIGVLVARAADCQISDNELILGGLAKARAVGLALDGGGSLQGGPSVSHNRVVGGAAQDAVGLSSSGVRGLLAEKNEIHGCSRDVNQGASVTPCLSALTSKGLLSENDVETKLLTNYVFGGFGAEAVGCALAVAGQPADGAAVELRFSLCLAQGRMNGTKSVGLQLLGVGGVAPADLRVVNNILGTGGLGASRLGAEELLAGTVYDAFRNNDFLPDPAVNLPGVALYLRPGLPEIDATADIDMLANHQLNMSLDAGFSSPDPESASAAGYHLSASCSLANLGQAFQGATDFDDAPRGEGTGVDAPEIGPDECP